MTYIITRPKNNLKKVYVVKDLCQKLDMLKCNVVKVEYYDNLMMHAGRIVIAYCSCKCGTLEYAAFKGDFEKFSYQLENGIQIDPLEFC